jgi:hypothetical protein
MTAMELAAAHFHRAKTTASKDRFGEVIIMLEGH